MTCAVVVPVKSMNSPYNPNLTLPKRLLRHGTRVGVADIVEAFTNRFTSDIKCSLCGWSLRRLEASTRRKR